METKLASSIAQACERCGLRDGMTISFHHHLRNGDGVLNLVLDTLAGLGLRDLTVSASSLFDVHLPLAGHIRSGVVTGLQTGYLSAGLGGLISRGLLEKPVEFRTHGGRASDLAGGRMHVNVAFLAAPAADEMGNCSGKYGPSACGSLGYAFSDAQYADHVVVLTDHLQPYPLGDYSIAQTQVDCVVVVDSIGEPAKIVSGTTRVTRDPVGLLMAEQAARVIDASGLLENGFSFQTGAGGASLAVTQFLKERMQRRGVRGSFALGGITGQLVQLLREGYFESLLDVQCFDLEAVRSIREDPRHREISALQYAGCTGRGAAVDRLDVVILGATEIDEAFNVNVHTGSDGAIMGGSGGHSDTAAGSKLSIVLAPLLRGRLPLVRQRVHCISTPGQTVDVLVTQRGIAVNPRRPELRRQLEAAGLHMTDICALRKLAEELAGTPRPLEPGKRIVARVIGRDGALLDAIRSIDAPEGEKL